MFTEIPEIHFQDKNGEEGSAGIDRDGGRGGAIRRGFRPRRGSKIMRGSRRENQRTNQGYEQKYENQGTKRPFQQQTRNTRRNARLIRPNFNLLQRSQRCMHFFTVHYLSNDFLLLLFQITLRNSRKNLFVQIFHANSFISFKSFIIIFKIKLNIHTSIQTRRKRELIKYKVIETI